MLRVFLDTSALFAAAYSVTGSARDLLQFAAAQQVTILLSQDILDEIKRNIEKKIPDRLAEYQTLIANVKPEIVPLPSEEVEEEVKQYTAAKDARIIAAAKQVKPDFFVTYDRKHLLDQPQVAERSGLKIVTPDVVVKLIREQNDDENSDLN